MFLFLLGCVNKESDNLCIGLEDGQEETTKDSEVLLGPVALCETESTYVLLPETSFTTISGKDSYDPEGYPLSFTWSLGQFFGNPLVTTPEESESSVYLDALGDYSLSLEVATSDERYGYCSVQFHTFTHYDLWFQIRTYPSDIPLSFEVVGPSEDEQIAAGISVPDAIPGSYTVFVGVSQGNPTYDLVIDVYVNGEFSQQVYRPDYSEVYAGIFQIEWPSLLITE